MELLEVSRRETELLGFQSSKGAHHTFEEVHIHRVWEGSWRFGHLGCSCHHLIYCLASFLRWLDIFGTRAELLRSFSVLVGRGIFQWGLALGPDPLGIGLHLLSSLWRLILYCREHFVAAHTCYPLSIILAICWSFQIGISIVAGSSILWIKKICDVLACLSYCIWLRYVSWLSILVICCIHT